MNQYKRLEIIRGGQTSPKILENGDQYDSISRVIRTDGTVWHTGQYVNTDHTRLYNGGIIAESENLAGLVCESEKRGVYIRIFDAKYIDLINQPDDWYDYNTLKSLVPNSNHGGKMIVTNDLYHRGCIGFDGSKACITEHPSSYNTTMSEFKVGEKILISVGRRIGWIAPEFYNGK